MERKTFYLRVEQLAGIVFLFSCSYSFLQIEGFTICMDEFGYWANAAWWAGYDWSEIMSFQLYFSFGYSILLIPFVGLLDNMVWAYRLAILLNYCMIYAVFCCMKKMLCDTGFIEKERVEAYCCIALTYPSIFYYANMTMAETFLLFLFTVSSCAFYQMWKQPTFPLGAVSAILIVWMYYTHMRTIGILIVWIICMAVGIWKNDGHDRIVFVTALITAIILVIAGTFVQRNLIDGLYAGVTAEKININGYKGHLQNLQELFSHESLGSVFMSACGKIFYFCSATYGLALGGICTLITHIRAKNAIYKKQNETSVKWLSIFFVGAFMGLFAINVLAWAGKHDLDGLLYGRYMEFVFPALIALGLSAYEKTENDNKYLKILPTVEIASLFILVYGIRKWSILEFTNYFLPGMILSVEYFNDVAEMLIALATVMGTVGIVLLILGDRLHKRRWAVSIVFVLYMVYAVVSADRIVWNNNRYYAADRKLGIILKEQIVENSNLYYCKTDDNVLIDLLQFYNKQTPFQICYTKDIEKMKFNASDIVITSIDFPETEKLENYFNTVTSSVHFKGYYMDD